MRKVSRSPPLFPFLEIGILPRRLIQFKALDQYGVQGVRSECDGLLTVALDGDIMVFSELENALPPHNLNLVRGIDADLDSKTLTLEFTERAVSPRVVWTVFEHVCVMAVPLLLGFIFRDVLGLSWLYVAGGGGGGGGDGKGV